jgi:hypothetical protein
MYYLRTKSAADALTGLGIDMSKYKSVETKVETAPVQTPAPVSPAPRRDEPEMMMSSEDLAKLAEKMEADIVCSLDNPEDCLSCGS